ncbi:Glycosyltransferase involved in cell wall bisynthesis [Salinimicrobium catena]|uniref:Glycosyltransferase involved in cell wall bisynthesis n=1 Tax=Salinimicrobium catena TaxID=390640 RepID=A0A1H5NDD4_9FLAO|nr:Glycosyltransferase involved in cell wall bisynthesis [Salinimicrobium catena]SEE98688.1 Glycosyltransferase involved in cell wall bisynthesis [Salinimicrobium catena]
MLNDVLDSVKSQHFVNWECIIVDDGSTDQSEKVIQDYIKKDNRYKYLKRTTLPKGASHCRNIGLNQAKGDFCIFLDSDDLLLDFCLASRMRIANSHPDHDFWIFPMLLEHKNGQREPLEIPKRKSYLSDFLSYQIHWQTMCTFWKTEFVKSLSGFDPLLPRLNDPEIHIRAMLRPKVKYLVMNRMLPDSVFRYALEKKDKKEFAQAYLSSLILFIPSVAQMLTESNKFGYKRLLRGYLKDYFINHSFFNRRGVNLKLLLISSSNRVLFPSEFMKMVMTYLFFSKFGPFSNKAKKSIEKSLVE